jgi:hypothetical protein
MAETKIGGGHGEESLGSGLALTPWLRNAIYRRGK